MKKMMSVKSVVFSLFLIVCFSTYSLSSPFNGQDDKSPYEPQEPVSGGDDFLHDRELDRPTLPTEKSCGFLCKLDKAKQKVTQAAKSVLEDTKTVLEDTKVIVKDAGKKLKEVYGKAVDKIRSCHKKLKDDVNKFTDTTEIIEVIEPDNEVKKDPGSLSDYYPVNPSDVEEDLKNENWRELYRKRIEKISV